jgi:hypothetical protein
VLAAPIIVLMSHPRVPASANDVGKVFPVVNLALDRSKFIPDHASGSESAHGLTGSSTLGCKAARIKSAF